MSARSWTLVIPRAAEWLNANSRKHHAQEAKAIAEWRRAAGWLARAAKLPHLHRAHIEATLHFGDKRRRDTANYHPTVKAIVDGLVDHGLLDDDSHEYLIGPHLFMGEPGKPRVVLTIREVKGSGG